MQKTDRACTTRADQEVPRNAGVEGPRSAPPRTPARFSAHQSIPLSAPAAHHREERRYAREGMGSENYEKFAELQQYVDWSDDDAATVRGVSELLLPHVGALVDDFYAKIDRHPRAAAVITGGEPQVARLKKTLRAWIERLLTGPYDVAYAEARYQAGRRHVLIGLDQVYTNAAMARLRSGFVAYLGEALREDPEALTQAVLSLNKLLDLDLALIEDAYQTEFLARQQSLGRENQQLRGALAAGGDHGGMVGSCPKMQELYRLIERAAPTDEPILLEGESGTGKELVAAELHRRSRLADRPMVVVNCAALPESLLESELFGHEKGSFTSADAVKRGLFEAADRGTLFIDEIGELAPELQTKLLRVLENGVFRRVGGLKEQRVDVRLIVATNRDLAADVASGRFRDDLYYRINVLTLKLPPLRERLDDLRMLVEHFAGEEWRFGDGFLHTIQNYGWPGNVRQLRNAIERAKILAEDDELLTDNLPPEIVRQSRRPRRAIRDGSEMDEVNRRHVIETYRRHNGNKAKTARELGINRRSLYRMLERFGVEQGEH